MRCKRNLVQIGFWAATNVAWLSLLHLQLVGAVTGGTGGSPPLLGCVRRRPTLPLPGGGSTIGAGGLSFRVRDVSGRFPLRYGRRDVLWGCCSFGGGVVVVWGLWCGGFAGNCTVDALHAKVRVHPVRLVRGGGWGVWSSPRPISTGQLRVLPRFHFRPINPVVCGGPYQVNPVGVLILEQVSRLDAFSGYPSRT